MKRKIVWAFDPFEDDLQLPASSVAGLLGRLQESDGAVYPVYVHTPVVGAAVDLVAIEAAMAERLKQMGARTEAPQILTNTERSLALGVETLLRHAKELGAQLFLVSSHGRRGLKRMTFGSFAETLLISSHIPLLFLNRYELPPQAMPGRVLWASDFSSYCEKAFFDFLDRAKGLCEDVIIYHDVNFLINLFGYEAASGVGGSVSAEWVEDQEKWAKQEAALWKDEAIRRGLTATTVVGGAYDVSRSILKEAQERGAGWIALASQSGPVASMLLGSHARDLIRSGTFPVWIYGPAQFAKDDET